MLPLNYSSSLFPQATLSVTWNITSHKILPCGQAVGYIESARILPCIPIYVCGSRLACLKEKSLKHDKLLPWPTNIAGLSLPLYGAHIARHPDNALALEWMQSTGQLTCLHIVKQLRSYRVLALEECPYRT